jgi:hypothetical protein
MTAIGAARMLSKLDGWGVDRAVAAIEESIANGWQGVFDHGDRPTRGGTSTDRGAARVHGNMAEDRRTAQAAREFDEPAIPIPIYRPAGLAGATAHGNTGGAVGGGRIAVAASGEEARRVAG